MGYLQIDLSTTSPEFRAGFLAAIDFLSGADFTVNSYETSGRTVTVTAADQDNRSYAIREGRVVFVTSGVEL